MIILPDKNVPRTKFLYPVPIQQWREPSQAQWKDQLGNPGIRVRFRVRAKTHDGVNLWVGWFNSRDDFDAFLWAVATRSLQYEKPLWRLPTPAFPGLDPDLLYDFATVTFLTTTGSNQTYTSPSDWNNLDNTVDCLGGGASGGAARGTTAESTGGGGPAWSQISNFSFASPGTTTATYRIGSGGNAVVQSINGNTDGNNGTVTYFNTTGDPGPGSNNSKCSAAPGLAGESADSAFLLNGGLGGSDSDSWGQSKNPGGTGGSFSGASGGVQIATGGGGPAGPSGLGGDGGNTPGTTTSSTSGGRGDGNTVGPGGSGGQAGNDGTAWDATHGPGSGGGGNEAGAGGAGGNYGGGGGGSARDGATATSGAGKQGIIVTSYTPQTSAGFNMPNLGF